MNLERRQAARVPVTAPVMFRTANAQEGDGQTLNVSSSGILFGTQASPGSCTEVIVYFKLAGRQFLVEGEILRTTQNQMAVVFREEPRGLQQVLNSMEKKESRRGRRVQLRTLIRVRRESESQAEVLQPVDVSRGGLSFQSVREYRLGEVLHIALHYDPRQPDAALETASCVVRIERLPQWEAFEYGVQFHGQ